MGKLGKTFLEWLDGRIPCSRYGCQSLATHGESCYLHARTAEVVPVDLAQRRTDAYRRLTAS